MPRRFYRDFVIVAVSLCAASAAAGSSAFAGTLPVGNTAVEQSADQWTASFNSQVQYYSWESSYGYPPSPSNPDGDGSQLYIPVGLQLAGQLTDVFGVEFLIRSGYTDSRQSSGGVTGETRGLTDTSLSASLNYTGWSMFQPFISLNTNLPTGNASHSGGKGSMDADVIAAQTFGEGFNGGVSAGANIPFSDVLIGTVGAGYTYRGSYDTIVLGNLDPGDTYSFSVGLGYQGDSLTAQGQVAYTGETKTKRNGAPYYQSGGSLASTLGLSYAWNDAIASRANLSYSHYEKNKVLVGGVPPLVSEAFNSNSNVFQIDLDTTYSSETFSIGPTLGFLYRDHNAWSPTSLQFLSEKTRWSVGLTGQYALSATSTISAQVSRIWLHQGENPGTSTPSNHTDAWLLTLGTSWHF